MDFLCSYFFSVFWFCGLYGDLDLLWISCYCNQPLLLLYYYLLFFSFEFLNIVKKNSTLCIIFFSPAGEYCYVWEITVCMILQVFCTCLVPCFGIGNFCQEKSVFTRNA